ASRAVVEVLRQPRLAVLELDLDRRVVDRRCQRVTLALERREVDDGLDQRADRPPRVERAVETVVTALAAADEGEHLRVVRARDDDCAFERRRALAARLDRVELADQRAFRRGLHDGVERRKDLEPAPLELVARILLVELTADEAEKRRVIARVASGLGQHVELTRRGLPRFLLSDNALRGELLEHEVAAGQRALRMPLRVVVRRPAHLRDEERELVQLELVERLAEVEAAAEAEAVNRAR